jgi:hypothetical protein
MAAVVHRRSPRLLALLGGVNASVESKSTTDPVFPIPPLSENKNGGRKRKRASTVALKPSKSSRPASKFPNFEEEEQLYAKGYKKVVGVDEAGRGPLAGFNVSILPSV